MKQLLSGAALAMLLAAASPGWARNPGNPVPGAAIIPPADPAAAKPAASPAATPPAPVTATAIRHDRPMSHLSSRHRVHARRHHWRRFGRSERVAEELNTEELRRVAPLHATRPLPALRH